MNIRLFGSKDQIERLAKIISGGGEVYNSHGNANKKRFYLNVDDRLVEQLITKLENKEPVNATDLKDNEEALDQMQNLFPHQDAIE
jgi:hypothetical protein